MLEAAGTAQPEGWSGLVSLGVLLFAAAGFVGSLQDALDKIWDAAPRAGGIWSFIRTKQSARAVRVTRDPRLRKTG